VTLASALSEGWQWGVLAAAAVALLLVRTPVVPTLVAAGAVGVVLALAGAPLPG
jgi:chromate transporter